MTRLQSYLLYYFVIAAFLATLGVILIDKARLRQELQEMKCREALNQAQVLGFTDLSDCLKER